MSRTVSQTINLQTPDQALKYITVIDQNGIKVHAEENTALNYIQITSSGMEVFKTNGAASNPSAISVANFGETVRIGKEGNSRFVVNSNSLQAYSGTNNTPYFEVTANGLTWGNNTAATTTQVNAAAQTANNYIAVGSSGIMIYDGHSGSQSADNPDSTTNNIFIDSNSLDVRTGSAVLATFGTSGVQIFNSNGKVNALFGDSIILGERPESPGWDLTYSEIKKDGFSIYRDTSYPSAPEKLFETGMATGLVSETIAKDTSASWTYVLRLTPTTGTTITLKAVRTATHYTYAEYEAGTADSTQRITYDGDKTFTFTFNPMSQIIVNITFVNYTADSTINTGGFFAVGSRDNRYIKNRNTATVGTGLGAETENQVAIGKYNVPSSNYAFIIGNGTSSTRSNAFTVDWNGNVWCDGDVEDGAGNVLSNKIEASDMPTVESYTPTLPSTVGFSDFRVRRYGAVVTITVSNVTKAATGNNVLFTLPAGWRPPANTTLLVIAPAASITAGQTNLSLRLTVGANGEVTLYNYGSSAISSNTNASGVLTYIATQ